MKQLNLPPDLTLFTAEQVAGEWRQMLPTQEGVLLDGSRVQALDGCGLQLLLAFQKSVQIEGQELQIVNPSGVLEQVLVEMGMVDFLRRD